MSRDPLAVLRGWQGLITHQCGHVPQDMVEAIAQVEALVQQMRDVRHAASLGLRYHNEGPGYTEEVLRLSERALQPFNAGHDSEGGE